ncbi:hypothetical protein [Chryseobacterium taeanense]|uniref:hypothetical protein n=1 Tax=Chryseobacterium taeanense TaxID=311334 RepID=UPI0035B03E5F
MAPLLKALGDFTFLLGLLAKILELLLKTLGQFAKTLGLLAKTLGVFVKTFDLVHRKSTFLTESIKIRLSKLKTDLYNNLKKTKILGIMQVPGLYFYIKFYCCSTLKLYFFLNTSVKLW